MLNPDPDRLADAQRRRRGDNDLPADGRWRSAAAQTWLILRSGHGLASQVSSLGPALSGTVDVYPEAERSAVRFDVDLRCIPTGCEFCQTTRADGPATLTLESTRVGPITQHGWALAGTVSSSASTTRVDAELELGGVDRGTGELTHARFIVRTPVPIAALGLCDAHSLDHTTRGHNAELLTHLLATRDQNP